MITVYVDIKDSLLLKAKDTSFHVLFHIIQQSDTEKNIWHSDSVNKDEIMRKLQISTPSLAKHIASLKERKLIIPEGQRGRYKLNMEIFTI